MRIYGRIRFSQTVAGKQNNRVSMARPLVGPSRHRELYNSACTLPCQELSLDGRHNTLAPFGCRGLLGSLWQLGCIWGDPAHCPDMINLAAFELAASLFLWVICRDALWRLSLIGKGC